MIVPLQSWQPISREACRPKKGSGATFGWHPFAGQRDCSAPQLHITHFDYFLLFFTILWCLLSSCSIFYIFGLILDNLNTLQQREGFSFLQCTTIVAIYRTASLGSIQMNGMSDVFSAICHANLGAFKSQAESWQICPRFKTQRCERSHNGQ